MVPSFRNSVRMSRVLKTIDFGGDGQFILREETIDIGRTDRLFSVNGQLILRGTDRLFKGMDD